MLTPLNSPQFPYPAYAYSGGMPFDAQKPCLVFIHGAQNDHTVWTQQTEHFAQQGYNVLALDLPGHGNSKGPALQSIEQMADWLVLFLNTLQTEKVCLIGHSMGSLIALETAAKIPEKISKLALLGTAFPMKVSDKLLQMALEDETAAIESVNRWSHSRNQTKLSASGGTILENSLQMMQRLSATNPERLFFTDFQACNNYTNGFQAAQKIECPSLLILGNNDIMTTPKASAELHDQLKNSQLCLLEDCAHAMMSEQPEAVIQALTAFMEAAQ